MKKLIALILCFVLILGGCYGDFEKQYEEDTKYDLAAENEKHREELKAAYKDGYEYGTWQSYDNILAYIDILEEGVFKNACNESGLDPEEAFWIASDYLDGEYVSKEDLCSALIFYSSFCSDFYNEYGCYTNMKPLKQEIEKQLNNFEVDSYP